VAAVEVHDAGMDTSAIAELRLQRFLETEPVIWLSTTGADGAPYLVPTWFAWDGATIVIRSKPHARKVRNLQRDPRTMLALGDAEDDFDVGLLRARAEVEVPAGSTVLPPVFLAKYADRIAHLGLTPTDFAATYSATIRLTPERALGWHGRSIPRSLLAAARRFIEERPSISFGPPPAMAGAA
jgi:PPOX class probable F420-dependent enzyme